MVIVPSDTLQSFHCLAKCRIESRVIPGKISPFNGGVISSRSIEFEKKKMLKFKQECLKNADYNPYLLVHLQKARKCSLFQLRLVDDLDHTATALAVNPWNSLLFVREW